MTIQDSFVAVCYHLLPKRKLGLGVVPWHSLDKTFAEMIESDGDLHLLIQLEVVVMSQQHNLIMASEVIIGNGDGG